MLTIKRKLILIIIAVFLALSGCRNPWMEDILGKKKSSSSVSRWNSEDFGPGAAISRTFNVANTTEWADAVSAISSDGKNANYIINVIGDFTVPGVTDPTFGGGTGIAVSLRGDHKLTLSGQGSLLRTAAGQTVILRGLALQGHSGNNDSLVYVEGGTFTMHGGTISDNYNYQGGGVYVGNEGTFTMNNGKISGNTGSSGGGVYVNTSGTFAMHGGTIYDNSSSSYRGGGVYVDNGTFAMHGGTISDNTAKSGGGVFVYTNGTFIMHSGEISGNTASDEGGGVYTVGTFTMHSGTISGNTASDDGGGVYVNDNTGVFRIVTGTIYGSDEADESLRNTSTYGRAALFKATASTAERGTFIGDTWTPTTPGGTLTTTNDTIRVVNGNLQ